MVGRCIAVRVRQIPQASDIQTPNQIDVCNLQKHTNDFMLISQRVYLDLSDRIYIGM